MSKSLLLCLILLLPVCALADKETTLFSSSGDAVAYIALSKELMGEEQTIYLWSGKPVAYLVRVFYLLDKDTVKYDVYGFNGKHLGWFFHGIVGDHNGDTACAIKEAINSTNSEPSKAPKKLKPAKVIREPSPIGRRFSNSFGQIPCKSLLVSGSAD